MSARALACGPGAREAHPVELKLEPESSAGRKRELASGPAGRRERGERRGNGLSAGNGPKTGPAERRKRGKRSGLAEYGLWEREKKRDGPEERKEKKGERKPF